jgi:antitoxin component of MazEF toxin-antitoxin module
MTKSYLVEELFQDIPGDSDNVLLTIPPEICEQAGWQEGDNLQIEVKDQQLIINKIWAKKTI